MAVEGRESKAMAVSSEVLAEVVRRIVEVAKPDKIILFGSAVRGEMGPNSDLDLLVIKSGEFDRSRLVGDIYLNLHGAGQAVDVVLVTPDQVERYRNTHCLIIAPALREGKEIYHAGAPSSGGPPRVAEQGQK
jgi:predicted nucleotidyltransferase